MVGNIDYCSLVDTLDNGRNPRNQLFLSLGRGIPPPDSSHLEHCYRRILARVGLSRYIEHILVNCHFQLILQQHQLLTSLTYLALSISNPSPPIASLIPVVSSLTPPNTS